MSRGFTLIEIVVVLGIMIMLITITTLSLSSLQNKTNLGVTMGTLISDIKQQQLKAIVGDTEGSGTAHAYGVHFDSDKYVLFRGTTYSAVDPNNFAVNLNANLIFSSINFPTDSIVFKQISGEIDGFTAGESSVTMTNTSSTDIETIEFNRYGVIY